MRNLIRTLVFAAAALMAALPASAAAIRVLSADDRGLTLQVNTEAWSLTAPDALTGRARIVGVPAAHSLSTPGHALLPSYTAMLAVPPDARPTLRVLSSGAPVVRTGVRLAIAGRPAFRPDPDGGHEVPYMETVDPIVGGSWPEQDLVLGTPARFRGRQLVAFEARPFRYDEAASRLEVVPGYTVRIEFNRPAGAASLRSAVAEPDRGMDAALGASVLNFEQARAWRVAPRGAAGSPLFAKGSRAAAFDENDVEVRVKVDSTGLYQIPYDLLVTKGYPSGVPIAQVSVHRHEFIENATPSYATMDVPVEVDDLDQDGVFGPGDLIWMYARNWADRSGASQYQRWWGDADAVFVTRLASGGARVPTRSGWRGTNGLTPLASYPLKTHYEKNGAIIMPFIWVPQDTTVDVFHWTPYAFYYDRPDTIQFDTNNPDTSHSVSFSINWVGRKFGSHFQWAAVKNGRNDVTSVADSVRFFEKRPFTASSTVFGSSLTPGRTNFLRIWGRPTSGPPSNNQSEFDAAGLNWFEVTYWRSFNMVNGILDFNSADAAGEFQIHATNILSDSLRFYDVTVPEQPVRLLLDQGHVVLNGNAIQVDFQDSTATGVRRRYIAGAVAIGDPTYGPRTPPAANFSAVTRRHLSTAGAADYLLIVPEAFLPAVQPLVDLRTSQGLNVLVAPAEAVYDEFGGGRHSGHAIQRFVRYAYEQWSSRFVLLFGDGGIDPQQLQAGSGVDWVPSMPIPAPVSVSEGFEISPSDPSYGCLTGNCNPQAAGPVLSEMMVGRLPANSLADANAIVAKLVAYETPGADPAWRRNLLLSSDDAFSGETFFGGGSVSVGYCHHRDEEHFVALNAKCASIVNRDAGLSQTNAELFNLRYYLAGEGWNYTPPADTCRPDRSATMARCHAAVTPVLFSKLNAGVLWWNYQGHANEFVLTHENLYINAGDAVSNDDKFLFANYGKPFLFSAFSCHANMFARNGCGPGSGLGGCLGEDLVTLPQAGGIGSWASSSYEVVPQDDSTHINVEMARSMFADPPVDEFVPGDRGARVVLGEVLQSAMVRYAPVGSQHYGEQGIALTYTLLGDPATRISIGRPQTIVTVNDLPVTNGTPVRVHTVGDTLRLVADLVSTERLDSLGVYENAGAGDVPVDAAQYAVNPAFPDTAGGGVFGGRRFRVVYVAHPPANDVTYTFRVRDRDGLQSDFAAAFALDATLRVDGVPIQDGDAVSPRANLSMYVLSPKPLVPATDLVLTVNDQPQAFTATPAPGDASGREWVLSWTHEDYLLGNYIAKLTVTGGAVLQHNFAVTTAVGDLKLQNLFAFPNPFDQSGTAFSFVMLGSENADIKIDVMTITGRKIVAIERRGVAPGYVQIPWNGLDDEGSDLANGVYFYRLSAKTSGKHVEQLGRLVKLRKPRHVDAETTP